MYTEVAVPQPLQAHVRRILLADLPDDIDVTSDVRASGYIYLGFVFRGLAQAHVGDRLEMELSAGKTACHVSGQVVAKDISIRYRGQLGHALVEFTALGHYELMGVFGEDGIDRCQPPSILNPKLAETFTLDAGFHAGQSADAAVQVLIAALTSLSQDAHVAPTILHHGLAEMEDRAGQVNLSNICEGLGVSQRHFTRQFTKYVGQSPKRFCRILQLNRALQAMVSDEADFLAGIASEAGFSDQSHFNRVFRQHLMTNPLDFLNSDQSLLITFLATRRTTAT